MGSLKIICGFGHCYQLTPLAIKCMHDASAVRFTDSFELSRRICFCFLINISPSGDTYYMLFVIYKVVWQTNPDFR